MFNSLAAWWRGRIEDRLRRANKYRQSAAEARLTRELSDQDAKHSAEVDALKREIATLRSEAEFAEHQRRSLVSENQIQADEIKGLSLVIARNQNRLVAEASGVPLDPNLQLITPEYGDHVASA